MINNIIANTIPIIDKSVVIEVYLLGFSHFINTFIVSEGEVDVEPPEEKKKIDQKPKKVKEKKEK